MLINNLENKKILITGGQSMIGRHIQNILREEYPSVEVDATNHEYLDLLDLNETLSYFSCSQPDFVINLAGHNGNISFSKKYPADIFYQTSQIALNCLHAAHKIGVKKCVNILSSCAIADLGNQSLKTSQLWDGLPNETIEAHGLAKRVWDAYSRQLYRQYEFMSVCAIVNNCFGPYDNQDENKTKAVQGIINRILDAKFNDMPSIECWGSGKVYRELVYAEDAARALLYILMNYNNPMLPINVSAKNEVSIFDLTLMIADIIGYRGEIIWDTSKPDGQLRKSLDISDMEVYVPFEFTALKDGLEKTINYSKLLRK